MRFYLNFKSDSFGKKEIDEPFEFDKISFSLKQKPNGMGRDVAFGADKNMLEFTDQANHELPQILYNNRKFGFESDNELTIEVDEENKYICDLDFATADTDDLTYFKCQVVEDSKLQIINARKTTKVDMFSNTDIDGNYIPPLIAENMFINAKPVVQRSEWNQTVALDEKFEATGVGINSTKYFHINPCQNLAVGEIEDSFTFFQPYKLVFENPEESDYIVFTAKNNAKNVNIKISDLLIHFETDVDNGGNGFVDFQLQIRNGLTFQTATVQRLIDITRTEHQSYDFDGGFNIMIPEVARGESVWIFFYIKVRQSAGDIPFVTERFEVFTQISNMKTEITLDSIGFSSIAKSLRLIDVMRQVIKSISGLDINAPTFDIGGILYDNRLVDGNLLRGINDKSFSISLEDIEKSITEFKADYEIGSDGKVFFGLENEFYRNEEMQFFPASQFSEMHKTFNPKYTVNEFQYLYKTFQSQKEIEEKNSSDEVNGEAKYSFFSKKVENKKVVEIEWIRSAPLIEQTRRKAFELIKNTSSQEDDSLFCIDTIETTADKSISDVYTFSHTYNSSTGKLILRNDNSVNFIALGIVVGSSFIIKTPDINAANYTVFSVDATELQLTRVSAGTNSGAGDGVRQTNFIYFIDMDYIPFSNYTDEGFTSIENINGSDNYSNLRYSIRRNINNFWNSYLAAANLYWKDKSLKNFWYKNNPECVTTYLGNTVIEGSDINPTNPILTPVMYNDIVFSDVEFADYIILTNKIRSIRGYIRAIDNNSRVVKIFPVDVLYSLKDKLLSIKAEEKFELSYMTIVTSDIFITINNETRVMTIDYEIKNNKVYIYDDTRQLLYNPVYWMEVSVNGATPPSIQVLIEWLDLLTIL